MIKITSKTDKTKATRRQKSFQKTHITFWQNRTKYNIKKKGIKKKAAAALVHIPKQKMWLPSLQVKTLTSQP